MNASDRSIAITNAQVAIDLKNNAKACATKCENDATCKGFEFKSDKKCKTFNIAVKGDYSPRVKITTLTKTKHKCATYKKLSSDDTVDTCGRTVMDNIDQCPQGGQFFMMNSATKDCSCCKSKDRNTDVADENTTIYESGGANDGWNDLCFVKATERTGGLTQITFKTNKGRSFTCGKDSYEFYNTTSKLTKYVAPADKYIKNLG